MRAILNAIALMSFILTVGCAHQPPERGGLSVVILPTDAQEPKGLVQIHVSNIGEEARCIHKETLENARTAAITVRLRLNGRNIARLPDGLLLPQRLGYEQLSPDEGLTFRVDLSQRFSRTQSSAIDDWEARIAIVSLPCSDLSVGQAQLSWSAWTPVRY